MLKFFQGAFFLALFLSLTCVRPECANGCAGHGRCTMWDMCICNRNWQGNDCTERICQFHRAWFDSPKGDLDSSGTIEGPFDPVAVNSAAYPYGTSESYPVMKDSDENIMTQSAHEYAECSNAGKCDRKTGVCECQPGFEGAACHRMSCPGYTDSDNSVSYHNYAGACSGHGVCQTLRQIAKKNHNSVYKLWDKDQSTACVCDIGYFGGDCYQRSCKKDLDPLYLDDVTTINYGRYYFPFLSTESGAKFGGANQMGTAGSALGEVIDYGYFTVVVFDNHDKPWETAPIRYPCSCETILSALEALPKGVVPAGETACQELSVFQKNPLSRETAWEFSTWSRYTAYQANNPREHVYNIQPTFWLQGFKSSYDTVAGGDGVLSGSIFRMEFLGNMGQIKEPEINLYSDGNRPTLTVDKGDLFTNVWSDGQRSEGINYWANHCHGVSVSIVKTGTYTYLTGFNYGEKKLLKRCLGAADHDDTNNGDMSDVNWEHGSEEFPHMVRLVRTVTDVTDGGYYVPLVYDTTLTGLDDSDSYVSAEVMSAADDPVYTDGTFRLLVPFDGLDEIDYVSVTTDKVQYEVYTTKGVVQRAGNKTEVAFDFASHEIYTTNITRFTNYDGNIACKDSGIRSAYQTQVDDEHACMKKDDLFFVFDPVNFAMNSPYLNMYQALSVTSEDNMRNDGSNRGDDVNGGNRYTDQTVETTNALSRYKSNIIQTDIATNWAQDVDSAAVFYLYKFFPHSDSTYEYVAECSNRGLCNSFEGECECFVGYTGDSCSIQNTVNV